jgi:cytochrome c oxidase subunit II
MPAALTKNRFRMRIRRSAGALAGGAALLLAAAPAASATIIAPEDGGGSPNADKIRTLYLIALAIGFLIFLLVEGILLYTLINHRQKRGGPSPAQVRGNTPLEVGWTIGAAVILVVLGTVTFLYLGGVKNPAKSGPGGLNAGVNQFASIDQPQPPDPKTALDIKVNGQQYLWRYTYPNGATTYFDMVVPYDTTVTLDITASDVIHSWWIPDLGGKADATPGYTNHTWFKVTKKGNTNFRGFTKAAVFNGNCAELCGENHADMRMRVIAVPVDQYQAWVNRQLNDLKAARTELSKQREARNTRE